MRTFDVNVAIRQTGGAGLLLKELRQVNTELIR
jgi:hypothetical protein